MGAKAALLDSKGQEQSKLDLDENIFGIEPNVAVMHQVVVAQLAAKRAGTHKTKTRGEKRGGGAKPWRQKGTGRARQGSIRSPQWRDGGVAHGPQPRSYAQKTPKKMKSLALRSALSDRAKDSKVLVVKDWDFDKEPSTKSATQKLASIKAEGKVLIVLPKSDEVAYKSFRNLPEVCLLTPAQVNTYDVLVSDFVVFTQNSLELISGDNESVAKEKESAEKESGGQKDA